MCDKVLCHWFVLKLMCEQLNTHHFQPCPNPRPSTDTLLFDTTNCLLGSCCLPCVDFAAKSPWFAARWACNLLTSPHNTTPYPSYLHTQTLWGPVGARSVPKMLSGPLHVDQGHIWAGPGGPKETPTLSLMPREMSDSQVQRRPQDDTKYLLCMDTALCIKNETV